MDQQFVVAVSALCLLLNSIPALCVFDLTEESGASGSDVVRAAISKIRALNVTGFSDFDSQFLRKIAYVETEDGAKSITYREDYHGGIWQVDEEMLAETQQPIQSTELVDLEKALGNGSRWIEVAWEDLRKPFYSALAAQVYIRLSPTFNKCMLPLTDDIY